MKNVVAYYRVSTAAQGTADKYGIDSQKVDVEKYCKENDMTIVNEIIDNGYSGAKIERPGLDKVLNDVSNPPYTAVVSAKSDRIARSSDLYFYIKYALKKKKVELLSATDDYSSYGAMGAVLEAMIISFASFERELITSRTSKGRKVKSLKGLYSGGKVPYGYRSVEGAFVVNEEEADIISAMFIERLNKKTYAQMSNELNDAGITTKSGAKWYPSQIKYIIDNEKFYRGMYKYGDSDWVQGQHQPILEA